MIVVKNVFLSVKDFTVSGEEFDLIVDERLNILRTTPVPSNEVIGDYYLSNDYISHTDRKQTFFEKVYHLIKLYSLNKKVSLINSYHHKKGVLLDIGCGTGDFLTCAAKLDWNVLGFEPNSKAKTLAVSKGVEICDDLDTIENGSVDVLTLWHVLEHIPDLDAQVQEFVRLLNKQGVLVIAVPNYESYDATYYKEYWAAYDVPRHLWHFSKESLTKLLENYGFQLESIKPMYFDSFYVSLLSEKYKSGRLNWLKAFRIGCLSNFKARKTMNFSSLIYVFKLKE
ncbi:methyltransferase domain-containing protein [Myroides sp. BIT-d1]|uniref:Methyltransferase domain-containing protein n=1 Tax=Myroides albus TaxID=2562892 RepID=A0A6I3LJ67_9FLAO|nr:methyltransferase domain-containing protein [Myroides albus]MVX36714.1 methyltransferase domain-containing protein [Myroides sp. LoEW2-1]